MLLDSSFSLHHPRGYPISQSPTHYTYLSLTKHFPKRLLASVSHTLSHTGPSLPLPPQLMPNNILAIVNATGRQAASVARVGAAVGYQIRAHVSKRTLLVAQELESLDNVTLYEGSLADKDLIARLFAGAHRTFINTLTWGDEVAIGKSLADAAKKANIKHYIYSSMPDHSVYGMGWPAAPLWASKFTVENYIRQVNKACRDILQSISISMLIQPRLASPPPSSTQAFTTTISPPSPCPSSA